MGRVVLHVDANSFYASVEVLYRPQLRGKPVSVCGDPAARHGIVLASTPPAKRCGVRTGMAIWQAKQLCPSLICVSPDYLLSASLHPFDRSMPSGLTEAEKIRLSEFLRLAQDTVRNWK